MQSTKPSIYSSNSAFDYYPTFTAWEYNEQPSVSLKVLNRHLSYLQNQYRTITKGQHIYHNEPSTKIWRRKSQSKESFFEDNQVKLPEVKKYQRGKSICTLTKSDKQNITAKDCKKKIVNPLRGEERKVCQKKRSGSQFSQLREFLKGEVNQKEIFLHKNKIANISKTINLKTIKQQSTYCFKLESHLKPTPLEFIRKYQRVVPVRS